MRDNPWLEWKDDESGVSPVIAVILMVAITVVLAAVVYTWASGLAETGGGGGTQGSCSMGSGNFITMGDVPRSSERDQADYRMTSKSNGTVYLGADSSPNSDQFEYDWSGTTSSTIETGDSFQIVAEPQGTGNGWDNRDRFTFRVEDSDGTLLSCNFRWSE